MSTYTIQIYMAGLLAFAVTKGPNGMMEKVTVLVPRVGADSQGKGEHFPFVLWADDKISSGSNEISTIFANLNLASPIPSGWGGCILKSEDISIGPLPSQGSIDFSLDRCLAPGAGLEEFCWVPTLERFSGRKGNNTKVNDAYMEAKNLHGLAARFGFTEGHLKTYHLFEVSGRVCAIKSLKSGSKDEPSYDGAVADIVVWEIQANADVVLKLATYDNHGNETTREIKIRQAGNADLRRILIANIPAKECPQPSPPQNEHYSHMYDLALAPTAKGDRKLPTWDSNTDYPCWKNSVLGNPDFSSMPDPLYQLSKMFTCHSLVFQRPACPMATFQ